MKSNCRKITQISILKIALLMAALLFSSTPSFALARGKQTQTNKSVPASTNPAVIEISQAETYAQVYAISDVHGMFDHLKTLLTSAGIVDQNLNWSAGKSLLVVVGDSIDKGANSIEVVDLWIKLVPQAIAAGGLIIHTLGNHEAEFLANPNDDSKAAELTAELQAQNVSVADFIDPTKPRGAFLKSEPVAAKIGKWLFSHAGDYPDMAWADFKAQATSLLSIGSYGDPLFIGNDSILEAKGWWKKSADRATYLQRLSANGMSGIVQGHQPSAYNIVNRIGAIEGGKMVRIDTGMAPEAGGTPGQMLLFPNPIQMDSDSVPHMIVISADGTRADLTPESFNPNKTVSSNQM